MIAPLGALTVPVYWHLAQQPETPPSLSVWTLVALSALANVVVLTYHHLIPAHPKFMLRPWRRVVLRIHVLSGTVELFAGLTACLWPSTWAGSITAIAALFFHVPSALMQTRIVFGSRAVMVPSYLLCIITHAFCAAELLLHPTSVMWATHTFIIFNIYVWCRVYYYTFDLTGLFAGNRYTISILFAGATMLTPLLGALGFLMLVGFVGTYVLLYRTLYISTEAQMHDFVHERQREAAASVHSEHPLEGIEPVTDEAALAAQFASLDTDGDGFLNRDDVRHALAVWPVSPAVLDAYAREVTEQGPLDAEGFQRRVWSIDAVRQHGRSALAFERAVTDRDRAELVFRQLDRDGSNDIDLGTLLEEWGLPPEETQACLHDLAKTGSNVHALDFETFFHRMPTVWQFMYHHVLRIAYGRERSEMVGRALRVMREARRARALGNRVRRDLLFRVPFLQQECDSLICDLAASATVVRCNPNDIVIAEGTVADRFFVVADGHLRVTCNEEPITELGPGACFGEGALLTDEPRAATVTAIEPSTLLSLNRAAFNYLTQTYPTVRSTLVRLHQQHRCDDIVRISHHLPVRIPFLKTANEALLSELAEAFKVHRVTVGQSIVTEGEPGDRFYVIDTGAVIVHRSGHHLARLEAGSCFGETALLDQCVRAATVTAASDCRLLFLDQASFQTILARHPEIEAELSELNKTRKQATAAALSAVQEESTP